MALARHHDGEVALLKALAELESDHVALWECCSVAATSRCTQKERSKELCQSRSSDTTVLPRQPVFSLTGSLTSRPPF